MNMEDFLEKDYRVKVEYLNAHFSRMWTRFNFFLTIHSALLALSFHQDGVPYAGYLSGGGLLLAVAWYIFAATDNFLVEVYRRQVAHVFHLLKPSLQRVFQDNGIDGIPEGYSYAGDTNPKVFNLDSETPVEISNTIGKFRMRRISVTEMGVVFAALFTLFWVARLLLSYMGVAA